MTSGKQASPAALCANLRYSDEMESVRTDRCDGLDPQRLMRVREVLERHVRAKSTPGAVGLAVRGTGEVACWTAGRHTYEPDSPRVCEDDLYDLASLTKVVVTTSICMVLEPHLNLDERVDKHLPAFQGDGKDGVTIRHLLAHCAGLPAHQRFFETFTGRDAVLSAACGTPLAYPPGTRTIYSDLSFLLLGAAVERAGGAPLEVLARRYVLGPVGMAETMYLPSRELVGRIPPTEFQAEQRRGLIHGQVHDGNAWAMGGVAPHAGLFGTAADLGRFLEVILNGGKVAGTRVFSEAAIRRFTSRAGLAPGSTRALGWDTVSTVGSSAGRHFSVRSFGHTGFTGTSVWVDPERGVGVVLLTNRVHPTRENEGIRRLRPEFHDAVMEAVI